MKIKDPSTLTKKQNIDYYNKNPLEKRKIMQDVLKNLEQSTTSYETRKTVLMRNRGDID